MRIAIIGGGIAGLTAAWQLARLAPESASSGSGLRVSLFEASNRLGGIIQTVREGGFVIETGPDAWLTAKPWASDLARDLDLTDDLIPSNDASRKTWISLRTSHHPTSRLVPIPDGLTLMVPSDLDALENSPLLSPAAIAAYRAEPGRASELLASIPDHDESVASFTLRHFGSEVLERIAAPLLSGVFGGDVSTLSARAALPVLIQMERTHGSLIAALVSQKKSGVTRNSEAQQGAALFTTLKTGVGTLVDRLTAQIPPSWVHLNTSVISLDRTTGPDAQAWSLTVSNAGRRATETFDRVFLAVPGSAVQSLLAPLDFHAASLLANQYSSAVLVAFAFPDALRVRIPPGFGLLVPPTPSGLPSTAGGFSGFTGQHGSAEPPNLSPDYSSGPVQYQTPNLLQACTFADQKFAHRVPPGGRLLRAFFGGAAATRLSTCNNDEVAAIARLELARVLHTYTHAAAPLSGPTPKPLPEPLITVVRRLPASLPQYSVGHLDRVQEFQSILATRLPGLTLLGNSLHGLGIPDVIRESREAAHQVIQTSAH